MSWSALEQKIVERLKDKLGAAVKSVYTTAQYAETEERSQTTPNVGVIYQGYAPVSAAGGLSATYAGRTQMIQKTFYVVVAVRNALNTSTSEGARNLIGSQGTPHGEREALNPSWMRVTSERPMTPKAVVLSAAAAVISRMRSSRSAITGSRRRTT